MEQGGQAPYRGDIIAGASDKKNWNINPVHILTVVEDAVATHQAPLPHRCYPLRKRAGRKVFQPQTHCRVDHSLVHVFRIQPAAPQTTEADSSYGWREEDFYQRASRETDAPPE